MQNAQFLLETDSAQLEAIKSRRPTPEINGVVSDIFSLVSEFEVIHFKWIWRGNNKEADAMAKQALLSATNLMNSTLCCSKKKNSTLLGLQNLNEKEFEKEKRKKQRSRFSIAETFLRSFSETKRVAESAQRRRIQICKNPYFKETQRSKLRAAAARGRTNILFLSSGMLNREMNQSRL
ncbi:hypothetical protein Bca4012_028089 [Brassica carinata]